MGDAILIAGLVLAIAVVAWIKARAAIRRDAQSPRGLAPGTGYHIIDVEYSSGVGGGETTKIRVPRDPQAYARRFVPRAARLLQDAAPETEPAPAKPGTSDKG